MFFPINLKQDKVDQFHPSLPILFEQKVTNNNQLIKMWNANLRYAFSKMKITEDLFDKTILPFLVLRVEIQSIIESRFALPVLFPSEKWSAHWLALNFGLSTGFHCNLKFYHSWNHLLELWTTWCDGDHYGHCRSSRCERGDDRRHYRGWLADWLAYWLKWQARRGEWTISQTPSTSSAGKWFISNRVIVPRRVVCYNATTNLYICVARWSAFPYPARHHKRNVGNAPLEMTCDRLHQTTYIRWSVYVVVEKQGNTA